MTFTVHVKPSGHKFTAEAGETILDAALRHGYAFPYGCRGGACGACRGKLLEGEVSYGASEPMALSEVDKATGYTYFCAAVPASDVTVEVKEVGAPQEIPVKTLPAKVARMVRLSDDVMGLHLAIPESERLQFMAGQYVDFLLKDGKRRAFSIANPPHADDCLEFHIRRIRGGRFTNQVFEDMQEGDIVRIDGPHGSFHLQEDSDGPMIFLATGTGFGPIKAIIEHALAEGCARPMYLFWGARTRDGLYLDALAREWEGRNTNFHYIPVLSRPALDDEWQGRTGHVQEVAAASFEDLSGFEVYACGHPEMVFAAKEALVAKGLAPDRCYSDAFTWAKD